MVLKSDDDKDTLMIATTITKLTMYVELHLKLCGGAIGSGGHSPRRVSWTSWPGCRDTRMWHNTSYNSARSRFNREKFSSVASLSLGKLNAIAIFVFHNVFSYGRNVGI